MPVAGAPALRLGPEGRVVARRPATSPPDAAARGPRVLARYGGASTGSSTFAATVTEPDLRSPTLRARTSRRGRRTAGRRRRPSRHVEPAGRPSSGWSSSSARSSSPCSSRRSCPGVLHPVVVDGADAVVGDRVLVNKLSYRLHDVHRGDIVVFERPPNAAAGDIKDLIKRVVGLPGESVEARDGNVFVERRRRSTSPTCSTARTTERSGRRAAARSAPVPRGPRVRPRRQPEELAGQQRRSARSTRT